MSSDLLVFLCASDSAPEVHKCGMKSPHKYSPPFQKRIMENRGLKHRGLTTPPRLFDGMTTFNEDAGSRGPSARRHSEPKRKARPQAPSAVVPILEVFEVESSLPMLKAVEYL
eukprot:4723548-Amphidinium_carterae.1